jgi:hypothetical protein
VKWFGRAEPPPPPVVLERIRPVEVPVLTELKRLLGREDPAGALRYAYPKVVEDLARAYGVAIPVGLTHEEIVRRAFTEAMRPQLDFFDRLYRLYAPVRYGERAPPAGAEEIFETVQSLYAAEPMWRLYVTPGEPVASGAGARLPGGSGEVALP